MARYKVTKTSFIANKLMQPGDIIEYSGVVADNLEPVSDSVGAVGVEADGGSYSADAADLA